MEVNASALAPAKAAAPGLVPGPLGMLRIARRVAACLRLAVKTNGKMKKYPEEPLRRVLAMGDNFKDMSVEACEIHGLDIEVVGTLPEAPMVLVSNHMSYFDPLVMATMLPLTAIAKQEVGEWPVVGNSGREIGVLFVDRNSPHNRAMTLRRAIRRLRAGCTVLNFPEGTTTDGDEMLPFQRGIFGAARIAGVPVVPIRLVFPDKWLCWIGEATFVPHYVRFASQRRTPVRLLIGEPLEPSNYESPEAMATAARNAIEALGPAFM